MTLLGRQHPGGQRLVHHRLGWWSTRMSAGSPRAAGTIASSFSIRRTIQRAENGQPVSHRVVHGLSEFLGLSFEILRDSMSRDEIAQSA